MLDRLSNATLSGFNKQVQLPAYARDDIGVGILHLGAGAFFKAHQAVYTDTALELAGGDWGICAVSLNSTTARDTLAPQDGLYTLKLLDDPAQYRVIGSIKEVLAGPDDRAKVIEPIANPRIQVVTLTVTEKGYCLGGDGRLDFAHAGVAADLGGDSEPVTVIGILVAGLAKRFANAGPPVTIISCDNVSENGSKLRAAVLAFAERNNPALAVWIADAVAFPNTMVDSITPASDEGLYASVAEAIGLEDKAAVHREVFSDWIIEDFEGPRPAWQLAGAVFTPDVTPYESAKLRLVNAPHSALTYLGLLAGHETVAQVMADEKLANYFYRLTEHELIPSLGDGSPIDLSHYRDRIGARFANPSIHHKLIQIAADGSAKLPQRLLPPLALNRAAERPVRSICLGIAAWMAHVITSARRGAVINDPMQERLVQIAAQSTDDASADVSRLLALTDIFAPDIAADKEIKQTIVMAYEPLCAGQVGAVLSEIEKVDV